jgi:hypothetical protein
MIRRAVLISRLGENLNMTQWLWSQRSNFGPRARAAAAMAFDAINKRMLLFGGAGIDHGILNDTWQWDGAAWVQVSDMGPALPAFAMTYVTSRAQVVLLVGTRSQPGKLFPCQTWIWHEEEWTQVAELGPCNPIMCAYDLLRDRIVVLTTDFVQTMQTWEWDGNSWTQVADSGPSLRYDGALAYDAERRLTVLFGGLDFKDNPIGDTWGWNGQIWQQLAAFGPKPRADHRLAYDSSRNCAVLFGGLAASPSAGTLAPPDTWEWDGKRWTQRQDMGPTSRVGAAMDFDSVRSRIVLFGGSSGSGETWEYMQWSPPAK